jgi:hypothetical protein
VIRTGSGAISAAMRALSSPALFTRCELNVRPSALAASYKRFACSRNKAGWSALSPGDLNSGLAGPVGSSGSGGLDAPAAPGHGPGGGRGVSPVRRGRTVRDGR